MLYFYHNNMDNLDANYFLFQIIFDCGGGEKFRRGFRRLLYVFFHNGKSG